MDLTLNFENPPQPCLRFL